MHMGFLFEIIWSDTDVYEIRISGSNGDFSGAADVYEGIGDLAEAAAQLEGFPLDPRDHRSLEFGSPGQNTAGGYVSLNFYCMDLAGHAVVEAKIESDDKNFKKAQTAHFIAKVEAAAIDTFVSELKQMESSQTGKARLKALQL